jgi:hydrophobe/amphiphile efflux-3 (HAE3) family protein
MFDKVAEVIKNKPWLIIGLCLAMTLLLGGGLFFLTGHVTYQSLLPGDFPSVKALDSLKTKFGGISYEYVLLRAPDVTDAEIVRRIIGLEDEMAADPRFNAGQLQTRRDAIRGKVPVVQDYLSPFIAVMQREISSRGIQIKLSTVSNAMVKSFTGKDFGRLVREDYLSNPQASGQMVGTFVSPDRKAALILIKMGPALTEKQQVKLGADLEQYFKKTFSSTGATLSISGDATLARDFNSHIRNKTLLLFVVALLFVLLTLFIAFRRMSDTFLPVAVMMLSVVWTFGFTGWVGIEYTVAVIAVMPLILGLALTFVVPFLARYYEETERVASPVDAVDRAIIGVGVGLFLAAITNLFGFFVFGFSVLAALRDFGMTCAVGNLFVFTLSVTLLPAVIAVRDRRFEKKAAAEGGRQKYFDGLSLRKSRGIFTRASARMLNACTRISVANSTLLIIVFAVLIVAGFSQLSKLRTDSDLRKLVPASLPGMRADFEMEKYFGGHQQDVIQVNGDVLDPLALAAMRKVEQSVTDPAQNGGGKDMYTAAGAMSLADALTAANNGVLPATREQALAALKTAEDNGGYVTGGLLSADRKSALITFNAGGAQSTSAVNRKIEVLKRSSQKYLVPAGLSYSLGGITPLTKDMTKKLIPTETFSSTISLALCALVLIIIFRSFAYGLITLTVALAGVAAEVGFLRLMNWPLDIMTSLVSALVIGIGVNFGILFTHRYLQEKQENGLPAKEAMASTMSNLGRANVIAALTTIAAFVIVMFSGIVPLKRFGGVMSVAIAVCLVTSLTLMPALLYRLSRHEAEPDSSKAADEDSEHPTA